jgi:hypothetical protein
MKVLMKSKKKCQEMGDDNLWTEIQDNVSYWRTDIMRSGWRVPGPLNLDDEEDDD